MPPLGLLHRGEAHRIPHEDKNVPLEPYIEPFKSGCITQDGLGSCCLEQAIFSALRVLCTPTGEGINISCFRPEKG